MTKVLAFNCSPKMDEGNTALILAPFLDGMREAGAEFEILYTRKLNIKPCTGEYHCWFKTPGMCYQKDDMAMLYPKFQEADIWVFATPVYVDGVTGPMKNLMDRMVPIINPFILLRDGHCGHTLREGYKDSKVVLVSNCGLWGTYNFDPLVAHIRAMCANGMNREFAGALLRPTGRVFRTLLEKGEPVGGILDAAKEAGKQLVENGKMSTETLEIISRPVVPQEVYIESSNKAFQQMLDALENK